MTILAKLPKGTFNVSNKLNVNFDFFYNMAEKNATEEERINHYKNIVTLVIISIMVGVPFAILLLRYWLSRMIFNNKGTLKFGKSGKISGNIPYFRDIPYNDNIFRAYYICYQYRILKRKTDLLGAIILKWLKDNVISIQQKESKGIFKRKNIVVVLNNNIRQSHLYDTREKKLYRMLADASQDGYLENKEFKKWCKKSYSEIINWFDDIIEKEECKLGEEGLILFEKTRILKTTRSIATPELKQEAINLYGLKKYLMDYTLIKERESIEVELFEEYLIYAQIMGISKKVAKEFKDIYPEIIEQSRFDSYDNICYVSISSHTWMASISSASAKSHSSSYGGGSFGGGGGSFGGGGGGRRLPLVSLDILILDVQGTSYLLYRLLRLTKRNAFLICDKNS